MLRNIKMSKEKIKADLVISMKAGTKQRTQVLRMVLAEILSGEKAAQQVSADASIKSYHKRLLKSKEEFKDVQKLVELDAEIEIVGTYIPKGASTEQVLAYVKTLDLSKPFGEVMKIARTQFPTEGKLIAEVVRELQA
jgi:uncharacterized protein YqeY